MNSADWRDALSSLLPDGYQPEQAENQQSQAKIEKPRLNVILDRKRAGKTATIVSGFSDDDPQCQELAAQLKRKLAVGGSARGGEILLQGDRVESVKAFLRAQGYKVS